MDIPSDLISAVAERRVIPFLGAGFSASVGLPDWGELLARLAEETEGSLPYEDLKRLTGEDFLQIAEYLYLKSDQRIGPLRHVIERGLPSDVDPSLSSSHVELVNLGAPQIYTTNYDDLIESTYRRLGLPCNVVALGRDVAVAGQQTTQVVKYHGDLRHESTLVLTESSYFRRLDFESAMDVKFRADLLGRSVLFMGYSFRDINIRLIWFKLNQMMEDIPSADRRQSYIVRLESNPVLEELYEAVGLKTIVLDSEEQSPHREPRRLPRNRRLITSLGSFLSEVAQRASLKTGVIPGDGGALFATSNLVEAAEKECENSEKRDVNDLMSPYTQPPRAMPLVFSRRIPSSLEERVELLYPRALNLPTAGWNNILRAILKVQLTGPSQELTGVVVRILLRMRQVFSDGVESRNNLMASDDVDWEIIWKGSLSQQEVEHVLDTIENEVQWNESEHADEDIAYAADIATRLVAGHLTSELTEDVRSRAQDLLDRCKAIYPSIRDLKADESRPALDGLLESIKMRREELPDFEDSFDFNYIPGD